MLQKQTIAAAISLAACAAIHAKPKFVDPADIPGFDPPVKFESVEYQKGEGKESLSLKKGSTICFIGGGLGSRMAKFNHFETELHLRYPELDLKIRNMCDEGHTPAHRQQPNRNNDGQYAFPGAEKLVDEKFKVNSLPIGHYETEDQWLARHKADVVIGFFGFSSSFDGEEGLARYKKEFDAFIRHTRSQLYNGKSVAQLAIVAPSAFQNLSEKYNTPDGKVENQHIALYTKAMQEIAASHGVLCIDLVTPTKAWYKDGEEYTRDGAIFNDRGYKTLAPLLADKLFGEASQSKVDEPKRSAVHKAVSAKNWAWMNIFKIPNSVHVYGRRYNPYGPQNYPFELQKTREMMDIRERSIWAALKGQPFDVEAADAKTSVLPPVPTNYAPDLKTGVPEYETPSSSESKITMAEGYKIELFASEEDFPNLANPCQMSFDNKGRLWVSTMASYPHYRIGDPLPEDKLLILEDTDGDGKADKETVFAGDLHIPIGFEIAAEGVYVSQSDSVVLLKDTDGDDHYDEKEILFSGFDDHDTHHAISAFCADPSGAILMGEGVFLHTSVETAYGTVRGTNGGFYRYAPQTKHLMRYAQFEIPNPWGIAFDEYGQDFFLHGSGTNFSWMLPGSPKTRYGANMPAPSLLTSHAVRPTSGLEFVSSRHFPDDVQGDVLLNNCIGFLGTKQHQVIEEGTGFTTKFRQSLIESSDQNYRPVDLEFAPDGSLYIVDWHNTLIGHMQHNARDPLRDHVHGRIFRVTYPSRPLVTPAKIHGASIDQLLENLKLPEYRSRYRTKRELRGRDNTAVAAAASAWAAQQTEERLMLEALWVTWGANQVDGKLLKKLLKAEDHRVRSAAVRVLRHNLAKVPDHAALLEASAKDENGRVRLETMVAASFLEQSQGLEIVELVKANGVEEKFHEVTEFSQDTLNKVKARDRIPTFRIPQHVKRVHRPSYKKGAQIFERESYCGTCHQKDGKGLPDAGFPPLAGSKWVIEDPERLIKLTLKGLIGPIEVRGKKYPGHVPMTGFGGLLNDKEVADVLTYVRNNFGNRADPIFPEQVAKVRKEIESQNGFYNAEALLKEHPHEEE